MSRCAFRVALSALAAILTLAPEPARPQQAPPASPQRQIEQQPPPFPHPPLARAIKRQRFRNEYIGMEGLIDSLALKDGMTVLDIGAGPGYASFLFAEKLHGSGEVFATDIRRDFVDHIQEEAKKRGLRNLSAVTVKADGLDEFYSKHRYDVVFLSNVYHCFEDRIDYFMRLQEFLREGARLVLVMYNQTPLFGSDDLVKVEGLAKALSGETEEGPVARYLSDTTRRLLRDASDVGGLKMAVVDDLNRMVVDPQFYKGFYRDSYFTKDVLSPAERELANWLLMTLGESGTLEKKPQDVDPSEQRALIKLNRLLIGKRFGAFLAQGGLGAYLPAGDANRHTSKYVMLRELDAAGYFPAEEFGLSPYFDAVIMVPRAQWRGLSPHR